MPKRNPENRLLAALSEKERKALLAQMSTVRMESKALVYEKNAPIKKIYFPLSGVFSIVSEANGRLAEVATIGNEGMLGLPVFFRSDAIPLRCFAQVPGEALVMGVKEFKGCISDINSSLSRLLYRYTQAVFNQLAQHAACNSLHDIETRCARWLLMTHDRVAADTFPLTHEFLSQMLAVRRPSVTEIAGRLQKAGLITYEKGIMHILDRKGLENAACEHYTMIRDEYTRLTP
jgi:CRP-like cAMP-binding protein